MHYDEEKALILYAPPCEKKTFKFFTPFAFFEYFNNVFKSRSRYYYLLLSIFAVSSVVARCIHIQASELGNNYVAELFAVFSNKGFFAIITNGSIGFCTLLSFVTFFSAFTVFSFITTVVTALHFYYSCSYLLFIIVDKALGLSFFNCLFIIVLFTLVVLTSILFFAEAILLYKHTENSSAVKKKYLLFSVAFVLYLLIFYASLNYIFVLSLS